MFDCSWFRKLSTLISMYNQSAWNPSSTGTREVLLQAVMMDPKHNPGFVQHDGSPIEFGGNTPTGGKFAEPWDRHGGTADPEHRGDSGFKTNAKSYYYDAHDDRQARIRKEVSKCTREDRDE